MAAKLQAHGTKISNQMQSVYNLQQFIFFFADARLFLQATIVAMTTMTKTTKEAEPTITIIVS